MGSLSTRKLVVNCECDSSVNDDLGAVSMLFVVETGKYQWYFNRPC